MYDKIHHDKLVLGIKTVFSNYINENKASSAVCLSPYQIILPDSNQGYIEADIGIVCDRTKVEEHGCTCAPDLVIEVISLDSKYMDYVTKPHLYDKLGVREYWIVNMEKENTMIYRFETADFFVGMPTFDEEIAPEVFPEVTICLRDLMGEKKSSWFKRNFRENAKEIEAAIRAISGSIPDDGKSLEEYREERLKKYL